MPCVLGTMYLLLWMASAYALVSMGCFLLCREAVISAWASAFANTLFCLDAKCSSRWNGGGCAHICAASHIAHRVRLRSWGSSELSLCFADTSIKMELACKCCPLCSSKKSLQCAINKSAVMTYVLQWPVCIVEINGTFALSHSMWIPRFFSFQWSFCSRPYSR